MDLLQIGYFSKTHGVKGQLVLKSDRDFSVDEVKAVFIEVSGAKAPYFISEIKESNNGIIVGLEDVDAIEKARGLVGKQVFIDASLVEEEENDSDWLGYALIDKHFGNLGKITDVTDNGVQTLVSLTFRDREVILPMVEQFIEEIDEAGKIISYNAPEGLIDLYLNVKEDDEAVS